MEMRRTTISTLYNWSILLTKGIIITSSVIIVVLTCTQVVLRYVFKNPLLGPEELSITVVLWLLFAGAAYTGALSFHITGGVPVKNDSIRRLLETGYSLFGLVIFLIFGYLALQHSLWLIEENVVTIALRIPYVFGMIGVLLGILLMAAYLVREAIARLKALGKTEKRNPQ
ncbi:MAG: TRAP transporter small permease [Chloroflexota bacterium]|nr:MAG: TRAP transporter small permease [Chloroflexota bacterium]